MLLEVIFVLIMNKYMINLNLSKNAVGSVPEIMDYFLLIRSTKTLAVRMKQQCENAKHVDHFLNDHL